MKTTLFCASLLLVLSSCSEPPLLEGCDTTADCERAECSDAELCQQAPTPEDCLLVGDEDGDNLSDCADPDCAPEPACILVGSGEVEPNDDGSPSTGAGGISGNDFDATAMQNALNNTRTVEEGVLLLDAAFSPAGDEDVFAFVTPAGRSFVLRVDTFDQSGPGGCGSVDTGLHLFDGDGVLIAQNDDAAGVSCSSLTDLILAPASTFFVQVTEFGDNDSYPYTLQMDFNEIVCGDGELEPGEQCDGGSDCNDQCEVEGILQESEPNDDGSPSINSFDFSASSFEGPFSQGATIAGALSPAGDDDYYLVTNTANTPQTITAETFSGVVGDCPNGVDTVIKLRDEQGVQQGIDDESGVNSCSLLSFTLEPGQSRLLQVTDFLDNDVISSYFLQLTF